MPDASAPSPGGRARHIVKFAAILYVASFALGVLEGFLTAGGAATSSGVRLNAGFGYLAMLVMAMLVFRCMTLRRSTAPFVDASFALLTEQAIELCVAWLLVMAWPSLGAPNIPLAAMGFAVKFAGMMLGIAWGIRTLRSR